MKKVVIISVFICKSCFFCFAQTVDTATCLEVVGVAMEQTIPIDGVSVKLYKENEELEMSEVTSIAYHEHSFEFKLFRDSYYTIEVSKPGYVSRMVSISTKLPPNIKGGPIYRYEFEMQMFKEQKGADDYYMDFPIALIDYDMKRDAFISHFKYTAFIKRKISETMKNTPSSNAVK